MKQKFRLHKMFITVFAEHVSPSPTVSTSAPEHAAFSLVSHMKDHNTLQSLTFPYSPTHTFKQTMSHTKKK